MIGLHARVLRRIACAASRTPRACAQDASSVKLHGNQSTSLQHFSSHPASDAFRGFPGNQAASTRMGRALAAMLGLSAAAYAGYQTRDIMPPARHVHPAISGMQMPAPWLTEMAETLEEVMNAESLELQAIFNSDHLFAALAKEGLITDLRCFFDPERCCLHAVVQLSSAVCGYPRVLHGGFTAAFLDEAFGLLFYSLRQHGLLPFISPAFTAHLDVSFKKKVEVMPGRLLLATIELDRIEGRKLWMKGSLRDNPQGTFSLE
ncbi:hypothetical protein CVIRNUC_009450 [Coccomyxa viridis]|uniref:Thioesterase domain-containing protein n=1 Tax=Coccomyxa viridis TaxID=1274662 RepID=A0AAV1IJ80_9CHLO|nr:hypothetical protein CVIRNUC_009450 [Coccomyxa viridis]